MDYNRPCKYGHYEQYGINKIIICNKDKHVCDYQFPCSKCNRYKMTANYNEKCKNYKLQEMEE